MSYDLIVVGGGFWGSAVTWLARQRGLDTLLVDDGDTLGASRNGAGLVSLGWYKQQTIQKMWPDWLRQGAAEEGLEWLQGIVGAVQTGEWFSSYSRPEPVYRPDLWLVDPAAVITPPDAREHVNRVLLDNQGWAVQVDEGPTWVTPRVVIAAGVYSDFLLSASGLPTVGVKLLMGSAVVAQGSIEVPHTYMPRPYTHYTVRPWGESMIRAGDTVERKLNYKGQELIDCMHRVCPDARVVSTQRGARPICRWFTVKEVAPGLVVATGGHRVGLALSYPIALRVLEVLEC